MSFSVRRWILEFLDASGVILITWNVAAASVDGAIRKVAAGIARCPAAWESVRVRHGEGLWEGREARTAPRSSIVS